MRAFLSVLLAAVAAAESTHGTAASVGKQPAAGAGPTWYGLSPSVSQSLDGVLNTEPDNANVTMSTGMGLRWSFGQVLFAKSYAEPLAASLDWSFTGELSGTGDAYRGTNYDDPGFPEFEPIPRSCYAAVQAGETVGNECFPRQVEDGAEKRVDYSDVKLGVSHGKLATIPWTGVVVDGKVSMTLPTSLASRNQELYTTLGFGAGLGRKFLGDKLSLAYGLSFSKPLRGSDTFVIVDSDDPDPTYNGGEAAIYSPDSGTSRHTTFSIANSFTAAYSLPWKLGASLSYTITDGWRKTLDDCTVELVGSSVEEANVCENRFAEIDDGRTLKATQLFIASLSWTAKDWLSLALALTTDTPVRKPNQDFYSPFIHTDRNGFSSVGLSATVTMDQLYLALR